MKTAVVYARFSSDNQRQESITAQLRAVYDYASKNDINITKVYTDEALTGTSDERPHFQQMISELPITKPELVLVHKLDRFARNKYDAAFYRREIIKCNARLIAVEQDFGEGPEAGLMESILEGFAEYFSSNLGREVKKGLTENAMQGKHCGGIPPLGYNVDSDGKYIINEQEAPIIKLIFRRKLEGKTYKEIQSELNLMGYKTKAHKIKAGKNAGKDRGGRPFGSNSIHDILRNEKYAGTFVLRKTSPNNSHRAADPSKTLQIDNAIPSIIDRDTFNRVQELLNRAVMPRHKEDKPLRYILTGKIKCGECGSAMTGVTVRKDKNAKTRGYYQCGKAKRTGECQNKKRFRKDEIEAEVLRHIDTEVKAIKNIDKLAHEMYKQIKAAYLDKDTQYDEVKKSLVKTEQEFINLTNAITAGVDPRLIADKLNEVGQRRDRLKQELAQTNKQPAITKQMIKDVLIKKSNIKIDMNDETSCVEAINEAVKEILVFLNGDILVIPKSVV